MTQKGLLCCTHSLIESSNVSERINIVRRHDKMEFLPTWAIGADDRREIGKRPDDVFSFIWFEVLYF